ncbi:MAG: AAA family ATPase [Butyricicoccus sp.]|nr:AAA family ATPase [Butyricicoccus sp.]
MVDQRYLDAEYGVLGSLLLDANLCAAEIFDAVAPDDFVHSECRSVFEAARQLYQNGKPVDVLTVSQMLGDEHRTMMREIVEITPTAHNYRGYVAALHRCAQQHRTRTLAEQIAFDAARGADPTDLRAAAEQMVEGLSESRSRDSADMTTLLVRAIGRIGQKREYYDFGFSKLSRNLLFGPGKYVILAARPSVGKTAFALQIALELSKKHRVVFFSCETDPDEIADRLLAAETWVDYGRLQMGTSTKQEVAAIVQAQQRLASRQLAVVDAAGMTVGDMTARALRMRAEIVIVDYVQIVAHNDPKATEFTRVTEVSRALQLFAKRHHVAVIALSQLSRIGDNEEPELHHLRSSGQLEQDADAVLFLYRPAWEMTASQEENENAENRRKVKLAKNRNGKVGSFKLWFFGSQQRFLEQWEGFYEAKIEPMPEPMPKPAEQLRLEERRS